MENDETGDSGAVRFINFSDEAGGEVVVIQQAVIAMDRPVRQVMPGPLDIDNAVDIAFGPYVFVPPTLSSAISASVLRT